jgi:tetratricopeptide (TPR) repeat protein
LRVSLHPLAFFALLSLIFSVESLAPSQDVIKAQDHVNRGLQLAKKGDLKGAEAELRIAIELASSNPLYLATLGGMLGLQQRLEEANVFFEKALKIDPENLVIRRNLATNQWKLGQLLEARRNLHFILQKNPKDSLSTWLAGMVAENLKDYANAAKLLGSVPEIVRQNPESIAALAHSYYNTGQRQKAQQTLDALQSHLPDSAGVFLGGRVAAEAEDYETAEKWFRAVLATYPDTPTVGYNLALMQYRLGRFADGGRLLLDLIARGYKSGDICNLLGWCHHKQRQGPAAVEAFEQAIALEPTRESHYLDLVTILLESKQHAAALAIAYRAVEKFPSSVHAYEMKGLLESMLYHYNDAVASFSRALELNPKSRVASLGLATAQWNAGAIKEAKVTFEKGIQEFPENALHYQEYGVLLLKLEDGEPQAVPLLEKALALDGSLSEPHYQLGNLELSKGNLQKALQHLEPAVKLDPKKSKIHYALLRAYRRLGRKEEASRELQLYESLKGTEEKVIPGLPSSESGVTR